MNIKWSPQSAGKANSITVIDDNTLEIDGEQYAFPTDIVQFDASGPVLEAHRDSGGELYVTVLRQYVGGNWPSWDNAEYNPVQPGVIR